MISQSILASIQVAMPIVIRFSVNETNPKRSTALSPSGTHQRRKLSRRAVLRSGAGSACHRIALVRVCLTAHSPLQRLALVLLQ